MSDRIEIVLFISNTSNTTLSQPIQMENPYKEPEKGCILCNITVDFKNVQVSCSTNAPLKSPVCGRRPDIVPYIYLKLTGQSPKLYYNTAQPANLCQALMNNNESIPGRQQCIFVICIFYMVVDFSLICWIICFMMYSNTEQSQWKMKLC